MGKKRKSYSADYCKWVSQVFTIHQ